MNRFRTLSALVAVTATTALVVGPAVADDGVIYDSIPDPLPSSLPSLGNEAYSLDELGDHITFGAGARELDSATVTMVSWACESGGWNTGDCLTSEGATFTHPLTFNLYTVDTTGARPAAGTLLTSVTKDVDAPYRPSADPSCLGGNPAVPQGWLAPEGCRNGFAFNVTFDLGGTVVPDEVIFSISYNTRTHGAAPLGVSGPYDSLNIGLVETPPTIGTDVDGDLLFLDSTWSDMYDDGAAGGLDVFRASYGWAPYTLAAEFTTVAPPEPEVDDCRDGGFADLGFRNQGQCIASIVANENGGR